MHWFTERRLERYIADGDRLAQYLGDPRARGLTSEQWLLDSVARRMVAWEVYGPLLAAGLRYRIVDVGAGFSSLSFRMAETHDYIAVDLGAHGRAPEGIEAFEGDWADMPDLRPDLIVAMDIFPNVDQRLAAFLRKYRGRRLRLALTTYEDRWYRARRVDAEEILTMVAWPWAQMRSTLIANGIQVVAPPASDIFGNGRRVCLLES
jgi:hypothetical protein